MKLEAKHPAESVEQFSGTLMLRMSFEAGIIDGRDAWMRFKEPRELQRSVVLMAYADRQSFHSPLQQETCVRIKRPTKMSQLSLNLVDEGYAPDDRSGDNV